MRMRHSPSPLHTLVGAVCILVYFVGCDRAVQEVAHAVDAGPAPAPKSTAPPNALAMPSASVEAVVNPAKLPAYSGPTGSVEGTVFVRGPDAPEVPELDVKSCPAALDTYGKLFRAGAARPDGLKPLADAVVVVTGYQGFFIPEASEFHRVTIGSNCGYPQRTIAMTFGQRLEIANASKLVFAPLLSGVAQPAVMIAPPEEHGDAVRLYPPRPGHYMLGDRMQPFVQEVVLVLRQPLHAVTDLSGHYRIDGVPTGSLKVGAQHDALQNEPPKDVDVRANVVENVDLVLTYAGDAGLPPPNRGRVIP